MNNLAAALDKLRQEHQYRIRNTRTSAQQIEPVINGQKVLSFCSNDYLGLANHPKVIAALVKGANEYGVGAGASHLITGHHQSHHALEEELADFIGCERTLLFSTGYMANLGVVGALTNRHTVIYADRLNHASLMDAGLLARARIKRYAHVNARALDKKLSTDGSKSRCILTDGVFSMDGTTAPITDLQSLAKKHAARLIVDDAHGIGVLGKHGKGCTENLLVADTVLVGTLGKAFGTFGAFVAAKQEIIEWCIQRARTYVYTTALPSALAQATRASLRLLQEESWRREKLHHLLAYFKRQCEQARLPLTDSSTPIQPIIVGSSDMALRLSKSLFEQGILVSAIRPPTVPGNQARLRITLSAPHTEKNIDQLVESLVAIRQSTGISFQKGS